LYPQEVLMPPREQQLSSDTIERLRSDIDHGLTGDKIDFSDPAAAPLGADDEAAGIPPSPRAVAIARRNESRRSSGPTRQRGAGAAWLLIAFIGLFAAGFLAWMLLR
jgi:hypothetical protein